MLGLPLRAIDAQGKTHVGIDKYVNPDSKNCPRTKLTIYCVPPSTSTLDLKNTGVIMYLFKMSFDVYRTYCTVPT